MIVAFSKPIGGSYMAVGPFGTQDEAMAWLDATNRYGIVKEVVAVEDYRPPMFRCVRCGKAPADIAEYCDEELTDGESPNDYVWENEGTLNRLSGLFACTECYIALGQPSNHFPAAPWTP